MKRVSRILSALLGVMAVCSAPAYADDSEVFTNSTFLATGVRPNILFVIDTSYSMTTMLSTFDPDLAASYTGACDNNKIYWQLADTKVPPACNTTQWISKDNNRCRAAYNGFNDGWWRGKTLMLLKKSPADADLKPTKWGPLVAGRDWKIECQSDLGNHGDENGNTAATLAAKWARNGSTGVLDSDRWGVPVYDRRGNPGPPSSGGGLGDTEFGVTGSTVSLYTGAYINWYNTANAAGKLKSRFQVVQEVAKELVQTLQGVNLGLMRYSTTNQGGMVTYPVSELTDAARTEMITQLDNEYEPKSVAYTPLSETLFEAYRYLSGGKVLFGNTSRTDSGVYLSDPRSRVGGAADGTDYDSPMDFSCQTTYVVYLTDGLPTKDTDADDEIESAELKGADGKLQVCPANVPDYDTDWPGDGACTSTLARYMSTTDLRPGVTGDQKVITYVIGFGDDVAQSKAFLDDFAIAGGSGHAYTQSDAAGLKSTLQEIISQVQEAADTTFVAPAVSVNAFNRSQTLNELYVSVFAPSKNLHWAGNLKKYRILKRDVYGTDASTAAVDPQTGFFTKGAQALNTLGSPDGPAAKVGGTAANLEDTAAEPRKLYTYLSAKATKDLTSAVNAVDTANSNITNDTLGAVDDDNRVEILNYARGQDLKDEDPASDFHHRMGDPMHARPAILIHGGTEDKPEGTVFVPTNDGVLHAFDMAHIPEPTDPATNLSPKKMVERWAFIPEEFLKRQTSLFDDPPTAVRTYGLDADVKVLKFDVDQNGIINGEDKAYIFFGTGRGGKALYAVDVTSIDKPEFMWKIDDQTTGFGNLGNTWSVPQLGRIKIGDGSGQNKQHFVLVFGGGYDTQNDLSPSTFSYTTDTRGNSLYIVDAINGTLLWSAGKSGTGYNFTNAKMTHSFPANLTVMDTDQDLYLDRIYAADMDAKVWRFDISNGKGADTLVAGGVLASLGNGALTTQNYENARRFYSAPDVASITQRGSLPYFNIAIGSGYRGHPLNKKTQDRFYGIRDYKPYVQRAQDSYTDAAIIKETDLVDVTDMTKNVTDANKGWRFDLSEAGVWRGEKNLSESVTAAGVILFSTFTPLAADAANPCLSRALNRVYGVNASNGWAFTHWTDGATGKLTAADRSIDTSKKGIASSPQVLVDPEGGKTGICLGGQLSALKRCVDIGSAIRSYWEHK
jgi:type IV pilus assembly protein PilY1